MTVDPAPPTQPVAPPAPRQPESETVFALRIGRWLVWFTFAFLVAAVIVMMLAFVLQLTNANESASFVEWVYRSADRVDDPFRSIYPSEVRGDGSVIDFSMLFGVIIYGLAAMFVSALIHWFDRKIVSMQDNR
jgi:uncharacterized protein YggT (Ycf19 family)